MRLIEYLVRLYLTLVKLVILIIAIPMYLAIALIEAVCYDMGR